MALVLQVDIRIKPGNEEAFMHKLAVNAAAARKEPGCRQFDVLVDPKDAAHVMLYEIYADERAFEAHQQTPHFKAYIAEAVPLLALRERRIWKRTRREDAMERKSFSRRRFVGGVGALALAGCATMKRGPEMRYRLGLSQPADSPNAIRLNEMAERVRSDTGGAMRIEVIPESRLGSDSVMIGMVQKGELELYLGGNVFGPLVPVTEMPGLPFTFRDSAEVFVALDGDLGDHIRGELAAKGLRAFRHGMDNGFHHLTTSTKPIRTVDDLAGMKIRTPVQKMTVEFFEALGAKPMTFTLNRLYEVCRDRIVDGQTDPLAIVVLLKLYEVQTYLSLTNHWWSGFTLVANQANWDALPADYRECIDRHARTAALAQRGDIERINAGAIEVLRAKGMIVNEADTSGFRKPLAAFYARWKGIYGERAWALLEKRVGRLV